MEFSFSDNARGRFSPEDIDRNEFVNGQTLVFEEEEEAPPSDIENVKSSQEELPDEESVEDGGHAWTEEDCDLIETVREGYSVP